MNYYDVEGNLLPGEPDLGRGWAEQQQRLVAHHEAAQEQSHLELMEGTEDLRRLVVDVPARAAWDETETVWVYHPYTPEELAEKNAPTLSQQVEGMAAAIEELALMIAGGAV